MKICPLDVLIIGAGPIGLACGIEAQKASLSYLIIDKGCLVNSLYNYPLNMTFFSTSDKLEIGNVPFISHHYKPKRGEALEYYRRVAMQWDLNTRLYNEVFDIRESEDYYIVNTKQGDISTKAIIIATGFYDIPNLVGIPGENLPKVHHYYREAHPFFGQKIAVIGAANSAVDAALETFRKGAEVTMVIRESSISDRVKYWVKPDIENRIKEGAIKAYFNASITHINELSIEVSTASGSIMLENDFVLAMTGYKPDFTLLKKAGIQLNTNDWMKPHYNPETMETNKRNIYLAGVICGGLNTHKWFIENSRVHAAIIIGKLKSVLKKA